MSTPVSVQQPTSPIDEVSFRQIQTKAKGKFMRLTDFKAFTFDPHGTLIDRESNAVFNSMADLVEARQKQP